MINAFQSLEDEIVSETVLSLASLQSWLSLSYGRFQMELCLNTDLIKIKREAKEVMKRGEPFDPSTMLEAKFLRNIIEEFLEVLDSKVFSHSHGDDEDNELVDANGFEKVNDACILYCERFMEFLIVLLSQLLTRSQIHWHGWIPYIELNAQGRARPSIAQLYNWRYRELGDLPNVKEVGIFHKANAGFSYDYQLVDVPDYLGKGETAPSPWFYQNEGEAEYVVSVYMYMRLLGYPASKISILTTYNGQKLLIRDVINRRCIPYDFIGPPSKVTTVDKFQGQQNDFILLSLVRTRFVGHLRDVRRLVVAMSRARLGLYVFCRRSLFEQCYELQPTFQLLLQRPDHLALNLNETTSFTDRHVADPGLVQLVSGVEEMSGIVNFKMHQVYQARVMGHQFDQFSAHSGQVVPSLGGWEEQNSQLNSTSQHQPMDTDRPADSHDANGDLPPESKSGEATEMEILENSQDGGSSSENNLKEKTDMNGDRGGAPVESSSNDENIME